MRGYYMDEREKKLLRYVELAARDSRDGCDAECQKELAALRAELQCSHEEAVAAGKVLMEELS